MSTLPSAIQRIRVEARDALELVLLPGLAVLLPWRLCFRVFRWASRFEGLYRERWTPALAKARSQGWVSDERIWARHARLIAMVDHADLWLVLTRSDRWLQRHSDRFGAWPDSGQSFIGYTFHWGCGFWALRDLAGHEVRAHPLVASLAGTSHNSRRVLGWYSGLRNRAVGKILGTVAIDVGTELRKVVSALRANEAVLVAIDVPPMGAASEEVIFLDRQIRVPRAMYRLAVERALPAVVFLCGLDFATGRRQLEVHPLGIPQDGGKLAQQVFKLLDEKVRSAPDAWHFWGSFDHFDKAPPLPMHADSEAHALTVESLGKSYRLFDSPRGRLRYLLFPRSTQSRVHVALEDVSFELDRGQCLGVVGDNGAGKSTLLKLIAGTLSPSSGSVRHAGRLTAILELGAGFHPEFTGRQNIHFAGALIGIDADEMARREAEIIAFSEIGEAIDRPVKTYSSGMVVRLAFALVTAVDPEILIIDEALAVGDQHFQKKCIERIETFRNRGCTILFCSHSLYHVRHLCDRAVWIDGGRVRAIGDTETVLTRYEAHVREQDRAQQAPAPEATPAEAGGVAVSPAGVGAGVGRARLVSVSLEGIGPETTSGEPVDLKGKDLAVTLIAEMPGDEVPALAILLERSDGVGITAVGTHADAFTPVRLPDGRWRACVRFPDIPLYSGEYRVSGYLFDAKGVIVYDEWRHCERFVHVYPTLETGLVRLPHEWS